MNADSIRELETLLRMQEHLHGPNSQQVAKALCQIGNAYFKQYDFHQSEILYRRALAIEERHNASQPIIDEIRQYVQRSVEKQIETGCDIDTLRVSSGHLSAVAPPPHERLQASPQAVEIKERSAVDLHDQIRQLRQRGMPGAGLADALTRLADHFCQNKQYDQMEEPLVEALRIREAVFGPEHLSVCTSLKNLARYYYAMEQYDLAEPLFQRALRIREGMHSPDHSSVADIAELYAKLLRRAKREYEAAKMDALVEEEREARGSDWFKFKQAGTRALQSGDFLEAQAMWLAALEETREFRFDDPRLAATLENLAEVYWKRNRFDKAEPLCKRVLQITESVLGPDHADVALALNNLALVCERQNKWAEATMLYQQVLAVSEKLYGPSHPDVLAVKEEFLRCRRMNQKQVEIKAERAQQGRFNQSGWWKVVPKEQLT